MIAIFLKRLLSQSQITTGLGIRSFRLRSIVVLAWATIFCAACIPKTDEPPSAASTPSAVSQLIERLNAPGEAVRLRAIHRLAALGPAAKPATETLTKLSGDPDSTTEIQLAAADALESIVSAQNLLRALESPYRFDPPSPFSDGPRTVSASDDDAIDGDLPTKGEIAEDALAHMGPNALPALRHALQNGDRSERQKSTGFVAKMIFSTGWNEELPPTSDAILADTDSFVPLLAGRLGNRDPSTREHAVIALTSFGEDADAVLIRRLSAPNPVVRAEAANALGRMGPYCPIGGAGALPDSEVRLQALERLLKDPDPTVRYSAAMALQSYPGGKEIVIAAREALDGEQHQSIEKALADHPVQCRGRFFSRDQADIEVPSGDIAKVPVFFATDRKRLQNSEEHVLSFGGSPSDLESLHYGSANVSIPPHHRKGEVEQPDIFKFEFNEYVTEHVVIEAVEHLDEAEFKTRLRASVNRGDAKAEVLIFIHGYNVRFDDALRRTGVLAYDLKFPGTPILYSWPSRGRLLGYLTDSRVANEDQTAVHLRDFLGLVRKTTGVQYVHVIAHSMGNRVLTNALNELEDDEDAAPMREIVFAAPDIDANNFKSLANAFADKADNYTLYASKNDRALQLSEIINGFQRAGNTVPDVVVATGVDTIDASPMAQSFLGHSYAIGTGPFIEDLNELIVKDKPTSERTRLRKLTTEDDFWVFQP